MRCQMVPVLDQVFPLAETVAAIQYLLDGHARESGDRRDLAGDSVPPGASARKLSVAPDWVELRYREGWP
jgi:hypothetical protein